MSATKTKTPTTENGSAPSSDTLRCPTPGALESLEAIALLGRKYELKTIEGMGWRVEFTPGYVLRERAEAPKAETAEERAEREEREHDEDERDQWAHSASGRPPRLREIRGMPPRGGNG